MKTKLLAIPTLLTVALIGLAGCGSSDSSGAPPAQQTQTTPTSPAESSTMTTDQPPATQSSDSGDGMGDMVTIDIMDFMYEGGMSVQAGQMVMVTNDDAEAHTLTSDEAGQFAVTVAPGQTVMFDAPTKPGTYAYHCDFHANMQGSLAVS